MPSSSFDQPCSPLTEPTRHGRNESTSTFRIESCVYKFATLLTCSCGLCGYLGRNPGEGVKLGSNPRKADEKHSLSHRIKSNQSTLPAKRTVKKSFYNLPYVKKRKSTCHTAFPKLILRSLTAEDLEVIVDEPLVGPALHMAFKDFYHIF
jgi:hypothetical protein